MNKPKIFLSVATYLPGYRGGGPIQSVKNLVEALSKDFDFYIFTANHDLGIDEPYKNIQSDDWNVYKGVKVFYSSDKDKSMNLKNILTTQKFSLIFLNSFFNKDSILILFLTKLLNINTPIILMPRGELSEGALNIKRTKKVSYLNLAKFIGLLNNINYFTTASDEYSQVKTLLNKDTNVYMVSNIPNTEKKLNLQTKVNDKLKIVFLSRITSKKNLDFALKVLKECKGDISFDIYGTIEEENYWQTCKEIIKKLPNNVIVNYNGELPNEKVISTLSNYDLFFLPTKSENYGHVISEALQASIPVLISDQTPWTELEDKGFGWTYSLDEREKFTKKIDELALFDQTSRDKIKHLIFRNFLITDRANKTKEDYIKYLTEIISY